MTRYYYYKDLNLHQRCLLSEGPAAPPARLTTRPNYLYLFAIIMASSSYRDTVICTVSPRSFFLSAAAPTLDRDGARRREARSSIRRASERERARKVATGISSRFKLAV